MRRVKKAAAPIAKSKSIIARELIEKLNPLSGTHEIIGAAYALQQMWDEDLTPKLEVASCMGSPAIVIDFLNLLIAATHYRLTDNNLQSFMQITVDQFLIRLYFHFINYESPTYLKEYRFKDWFTMMIQISKIKFTNTKTQGLLRLVQQLLALIVKPGITLHEAEFKTALVFKTDPSIAASDQDKIYVNDLNIFVIFCAREFEHLTLTQYKASSKEWSEYFLPAGNEKDKDLLLRNIKEGFTAAIWEPTQQFIRTVYSQIQEVDLTILRIYLNCCKQLQALTTEKTFLNKAGEDVFVILITELQSKIKELEENELDRLFGKTKTKKVQKNPGQRVLELRSEPPLKASPEIDAAASLPKKPETTTKTKQFIDKFFRSSASQKEKLSQLNNFLHGNFELTNAERLTLHAHRAQLLIDLKYGAKALKEQIEILRELNSKVDKTDSAEHPTENEINSLIAELKTAMAAQTKPEATKAIKLELTLPTSPAAKIAKPKPVAPTKQPRITATLEATPIEITPVIEPILALENPSLIETEQLDMPIATQTCTQFEKCQSEEPLIEEDPNPIEIPAIPAPFNPTKLAIPEDLRRVLLAVQQVGPHKYSDSNGKKVFQERHEAYFVGGMVRDLEQQMAPAFIRDVDIIVCNFKWSPVFDSQQKNKFFAELAQKLQCAPNQIQEIVTPNPTLIRFRYKDIEYDVTFSIASRTTNAMWRDFKCNSLLADADGNVIEILSGAIHEARNKLLSPCDENEFFKDWVRVLRALGFLARDNYTYVSAAFEAKINQALKTLEQFANNKAQLISLITFGGNEMSPAYGRFKSHLIKLLKLPAQQFAKIAHLINPAFLKATLDGVFFAPGFEPSIPSPTSLSSAQCGVFSAKSETRSGSPTSSTSLSSTASPRSSTS